MNDLKPNGRNDGHQMDYSRINDSVFLGSDLCNMGVCLIHGEEFKKLGVTYEINLSKENNELPPKEIEGYLWIPVTDGYAPSITQLEAGVAFITAVEKEGKKVYIHCKNGHARGPTLVAAYLIKANNISVSQAVDLICTKRGEIHIEDTQKRVLEDYRSKLT